MKRFEVDTICRLCLRADEKVSVLNNTDQKVFIESIIKLKQENYVPTDDLYICCICRALLTKSFNFMQTIWSAQKIICAMLKNTNIITKQLLYCLDRHNTGLNTITLSTVVTFFDSVKCESSECTSSDSNTIADIEELDLLIKKEKPRKQKNPNMSKINYYSKNQNKLINSNEDESDKCNLDEIKVEMCNNLEMEFTKAESSDLLSKELIKNDPIPETKKPVIKKNWHLETSPSNENKAIIIISDEDEESENTYEMEVEICNNFEIDENTSSDSNTIADMEQLDLDLLIKKEKPRQQKNPNMNKIDHHTTNIDDKKSISDEDEESDKHNLDEMVVEICNNLEIDGSQTESSDPLTKESNKDACDEPIPKKKNVVKNKTTGLKKTPHIHLVKSNDSTSNEKKRKYEKNDIDYDYQPDSTSHSEDSDYYDSYDDEGKRIKRPKDDRDYPMKCDHCNFEVLAKNLHYRHYQFMHPNIEYPYIIQKDYACLICGKLCAKNTIAAHEAGHTEQEIKCKFCPKICSNKKTLNKHVSRVHPKKTFTCDYCSKIFKTRDDITRHIRTHTGSKPFKCHICGNGFAHSGNRNIHIRAKHQNNYKYVPKKQKRAKHCSTDTEMSSNSEKTVRKTIRKSNKQSETTDVILKKKRKITKQGSKNKEVGGANTTTVRTESKIIRRKKENRNDERKRNYENAEIESDDENLAVIKSKNTQDRIK